jgi:peptide/nickel transport system permease protein
MIGFALNKVLGFLATIVVSALIIFAALDLLPGDPARFMLGIDATPEAVEALRLQLGLDASGFERFFRFLGGLLIGDFGFSTSQGQPVGPLIAGRLGVTLPLAFATMILSALIGLPAGALAARKRSSLADSLLMVLARFGIATPAFWFGMLLVLLFAVTLRWFPPGGFVPWGENPVGALGSLILPTFALALPLAAILARATRDLLVEAGASDYVRAARARGLTHTEAVWKHGTRNVLLPLLRIVGLHFGWLIAGTVIVENVFYLPGLGRLIFDAIAARDLILVRACAIVLVIIPALVMLAAELAAGYSDPRQRARSAT